MTRKEIVKALRCFASVDMPLPEPPKEEAK